MPDKKKGNRKEAKAVEDKQDLGKEFVKKSTIAEFSNVWFEFDTAAMVHTTNRKDLVANSHPITIKIP
jgi:phage tail tube protein FII